MGCWAQMGERRVGLAAVTTSKALRSDGGVAEVLPTRSLCPGSFDSSRRFKCHCRVEESAEEPVVGGRGPA